jgi:hypothetical protein
MSESAGSTEEGKPYQMKFPDAFGNVHVRSVPHPEVISDFFDDSNCVDIHNQLRQFAIKLEKKWITSNAYFCLHTSYCGINTVDCFQLSNFHGLTNKDAGVYDWMDNDDEHNLCAIKRFSGILARQLVMMGIGLRPVQRPVNLVFPRWDVIELLQESMMIDNDDKDGDGDKDKDDDNGKVGATSSVSSIGVGSSGGSAGSNDTMSTFRGSKSMYIFLGRWQIEWDASIAQQNFHGSSKVQMVKVTHLPKGVHMGVDWKREYIA